MPDIESNDGLREDVDGDSVAPAAVSESPSEETPVPEKTPEVFPTLSEIDQRLESIEKEIGAQDRIMQDAAARLRELRSERDRITAMRGRGSNKVTQAEAHQQIVQAGLDRRLGRAAAVQEFTKATGGVIPTIGTPAEQARRGVPRL